jgi:hypothetical protein
MHWEYRPFHIATEGENIPVGNNVSTTAPTLITPGMIIVTPLSMQNIAIGRWLNVNGGTGTPEDVQVTSITSTTFTATFQNSHSGAYAISSQRAVDVGEFTVNTLGSGVTITLYDGHPGAWVPGTVFAVITPGPGDNPRIYRTRLNRGLFYTAVATGAFGDYTITYHDRSA